MCTILFMHRVHADHPLIVAANRDERHDRPSLPPRLIGPRSDVLAGIDEHAGGTWMGVNAAGIAVGITNQRTYAAADPTARSRGEIVRDVLMARTLDEIREQLEGINCRAYNPFNLMVGTAERVQLAYARRQRAAIEIVDAPSGVHVLPNDRLGAGGFPKASRAVAMATAAATDPWPLLATRLRALLGDHALPDIAEVAEPPQGSIYSHELLHRHQAICIHGAGYGTRSSTVMALSSGAVDHYMFADGPPCTTPFVDYAQVLRMGA